MPKTKQTTTKKLKENWNAAKLLNMHSLAAKLAYLSAYLLTLCSEKNTHSRFLLYLRGKCLDLHKIYRVCLRVIKYSADIKIKYSLPPMT